MAPMVEMVGKVTRSRYDELVAESVDIVEEDTRCQFALGDAALELVPLRGHGGHLPLDEGAQGVEESLRLFAERDGLLTRTVHPTVPPKVEYNLTSMARELHSYLTGLVEWAERHRGSIAQARTAYDSTAAATQAGQPHP